MSQTNADNQSVTGDLTFWVNACSMQAQQLMASVGGLGQQAGSLVKLRAHFQKDVRRQLYGDEDDQQFYRWINSERKQVEKRLEDGRAVRFPLRKRGLRLLPFSRGV